jgi:predicted Zn-dependent protease
MGMTRSDFEALSEKILGLVEADGAQVRLEDKEDLQLRSANNDITSNGFVDRFKIGLTVDYGKRSADIEINQTDDESIRAAVKKVQQMAKLAPEDPEHMAPIEPGDYLAPIHFSESTAAMTPEEALEQLRPVINQARSKKVDSAGYLERSVTSTALANSNGLFIHEQSTGVKFSVTARASEGSGSGWASTQVTDLADLDLAPVGDRAIRKALDSRNAAERPAGRTTVLLEAPAVRDLEGESAIGRKLFGENVTVYSDPLYRPAPCGVHQSGIPRKKTMWIENGVLKNLTVGRFWARKQEVAPTPWPGNLIMQGEGKSREDLISDIENGVLITRLWYLRMVQPQTLLYTGLTRDGTFAIKDGAIAGPVNNFRFNESPANVLKNIVASGKQERILGSESDNPTHVPPLVVRDFNLSSVSEAS